MYHAAPGFPGGSVGKGSACNAGDLGLIRDSRRSPGGRNGCPLQCSCLENPTDRGAWQVTVHGVAELDTTEWITFHFIPAPDPWQAAINLLSALPPFTAWTLSKTTFPLQLISSSNQVESCLTSCFFPYPFFSQKTTHMLYFHFPLSFSIYSLFNFRDTDILNSFMHIFLSLIPPHLLTGYHRRDLKPTVSFQSLLHFICNREHLESWLVLDLCQREKCHVCRRNSNKVKEL